MKADKDDSLRTSERTGSHTTQDQRQQALDFVTQIRELRNEVVAQGGGATVTEILSARDEGRK
ncbi:MAG: hypothetical protein RLY93_05115 [Sumerlaeia bacterium]